MMYGIEELRARDEYLKLCSVGSQPLYCHSSGMTHF
jgi:hypothetical protein